MGLDDGCLIRVNTFQTGQAGVCVCVCVCVCARARARARACERDRETERDSFLTHTTTDTECLCCHTVTESVRMYMVEGTGVRGWRMAGDGGGEAGGGAEC